LELNEKPDAVQNMTNLSLKIAQPEEQQPPGTTILDVYKNAGEELLILGEPGAGKSTLLLTLAEHLVRQAKHDTRCPLPVVLSLSSWKARHPDFTHWMGEQISQNYDVPRMISQDWIEQGQIIPLLEDLDQVPDAARSACIEAINAYHRKHLSPLVICSRKTEYEEATVRGQRLALLTAVVIRPLTGGQIDLVLQQAGNSLVALRNALQEQPDLLDLATTPLILNMLVLIYRDVSPTNTLLSDTSQTLRQRIFSTYVQRMFEHHPSSKRYTWEMTKDWLSLLARQMQHNPVFFIEHMQAADWLPEGRLSQIYELLGIRLLAALMGILVSLVAYNILGSADPAYTIFYGLLGGVIGYTLSSNQPRQYSPGTEPIRKIWYDICPKQLLRGLVIGLIIVLGAGLSFRLYFGSVPGYEQKDWLQDWLVHGIGFGICGILFSVFLVKSQKTNRGRESKSFSLGNLWHRFITTDYLRNSLCVGSLIGLCSGLSDLLSSSPFIYYSAINPLHDGLSDLATFIVITLFISLFLTEMKETIEPTEALTWLWKTLINPTHLRNVALVAITAVLAYEVTNPADVNILIGTIYGIGFGLNYWITLGVIRGVSNISKPAPNKDTRSSGRKRPFYGTIRKYRSVPNEGIRRSGRDSLLYGIIGGSICGLFCFMIISLTFLYVPQQDLQLGLGLPVGPLTALYFASIVGVSIALIIGLLSGGTAYLRHQLLHLLLCQSKRVPWNYPRFLDFAVEHIFLQKRGGSYMFAHPLLHDHFLSLDATQLSSQTAEEPLQVKICIICGYTYRSEANFCVKCGNPRNKTNTE
jgi:energy-coupling factor transporter ATP-binding protein EcfA2